MNTSKPTTILPCPTCKKTITWTENFPERPFCSKRCKLVDLGEWASEGHRIEGNSIYDDVLSDDLEDPTTI